MRTALSPALVLAAGWASARDETPAPEPKLEGSWVVVKAAQGGVPLAGGGSHLTLVTFDKDGSYRLSFRSTMVTAKGITDTGGRVEAGTFRVSGRELDLLDADGKTVRQKGIFKFEKETFVVALGAERPKSFDEPKPDAAGRDVWVLTLRPLKK
jgi:hypothetical protein